MDTKEVFFRDADGKVYPCRLALIDAAFATSNHPHEWSYDEKKFAARKKGSEPSEPVGPNGVVGLSGGDPTKTDRLGVLGPPSIS